MSHVFTIFTVALAFLLAGLVLWVAQNVKIAERSWSSGARLSVVLEPELSGSEKEVLKKEISAMPGVRHLVEVSPEQAREELLAALGPDGNLIIEMEPGFFPSVLDVVISGDPQTVRATQNRLRNLTGVQKGIGDVRSMDRWNLHFGNLFEISTLIAALLCVVVLMISGWVIMSAARSRVETQVEQLRVLRSLGAAPGFVRAPLVLVSLFHGFAGGAMALGLLLGVFWLASPLLAILLGPQAADLTRFMLFTPSGAAVTLGVTALTGLLAARFAFFTIRV